MSRCRCTRRLKRALWGALEVLPLPLVFLGGLLIYVGSGAAW